MAFLIVTKRGLWPFPEFFELFLLGKVQNFPLVSAHLS